VPAQTENPIMDVSVLIVNYNTKEHLENCLRSLKSCAYSGKSEVFVVDNASQDGSAEMVGQQFPEVNLVKNKTNVGFATAVNQMYHLSSGKYLLLLNPDTLVQPGALDDLVSFLEDHTEAGAVGPRQWLDAPKNLQTTVTVKFPELAVLAAHVPLIKRWAQQSLRRKYWIKDFIIWSSDRPVEVDSLNGSCLMVRRETIEDVGVMDERFFLFFEDADWCLRMKKKGWKLYCIPKAEIVHFGKRSVLKSKNIGEISEKSLNQFLKKHRSFLIYLIWRARDARKVLGPIKRFVRFVKKFLPSRRSSRSKKKETVLDRTDKGEIFFSWPEDKDASAYLFEIAQDPLFLYKAGAILKENGFTLSKDLVRSGPGGRLFWRVATVYEKKRVGVFTEPRFFCLEKEEIEDS
jgi:GT2 family glycosyltransferase